MNDCLLYVSVFSNFHVRIWDERTDVSLRLAGGDDQRNLTESLEAQRNLFVHQVSETSYKRLEADGERWSKTGSFYTKQSRTWATISDGVVESSVVIFNIFINFIQYFFSQFCFFFLRFFQRFGHFFDKRVFASFCHFIDVQHFFLTIWSLYFSVFVAFFKM